MRSVRIASLLACVPLLTAAGFAREHGVRGLEIPAGASIGTAWPVSPGYLVTAHHLVGGREVIHVVRPDGTEMTARVVLSDAGADLSLLSVTDDAALPPSLPLARDDPSLGASVFTIGYPLIDVVGRSPKLSLGVISGTRGPEGEEELYLISTPIQPGNSGGPLVNTRGEVVGIVASMLALTDGDGPARPLPNLAYARSVSALERLLALLPTGESESETARAAGSLEELVARVRASVLLVIAS